jgi:hypothetical protein
MTRQSGQYDDLRDETPVIMPLPEDGNGKWNNRPAFDFFSRDIIAKC